MVSMETVSLTEGGDTGSAAVTNLAYAALRVLAGETCKRRQHTAEVTDQCVNAFCSLIMSGRMKPALNFTRIFMRRGADYEAIAENLFSAAARRMEDRWIAGSATAIDVSLGCSTLIRTHIAYRSALREPSPALKASIIFSSFVGQAHILGLSFAVEYFRRNGWNVRHLPGSRPDAFLETVTAEKPDIVGLTAATDNDLIILAGVIAQLRTLRARPHIIVGGCSRNLMQLDADAVVSKLDMGLLAGHRLLT